MEDMVAKLKLLETRVGSNEKRLSDVEKEVRAGFLGMGNKLDRIGDRMELLQEQTSFSTKHIDKDVQEIKQRVTLQYVMQNEFAPVKRIVYGMVAAIMLSVVGAIVATVLK